MTGAKSLAILIPMIGAAVQTARAQDSVVVDPTVSEIATGGNWTSEGHSGYYRVIIRTGGSGRGISDLTIEWLAAPARDQPPAIVRSIQVKELGGIGRLDRPRIGQYLKGWRVWILVTDPHGDPDKQASRAVDIGPPGEFKVARAQ